MKYEEDFVNEEVIDLEVEGYEKGAFKYKPTTAGEENEWLKEYMYFDPETKRNKQDYAKLNKLKLGNLVAVPYDTEAIKRFTGVEKEWKDLDINQKWKVLSKLKSGVFDKILTAITNFDAEEDSAKKA